eukprot:jgi/Mesen1/9247/ME000006S09245
MASFDFDDAPTESYEAPPDYEQQPSQGFDDYDHDEEGQHFEQVEDGFTADAPASTNIEENEFEGGAVLPPPEQMESEESNLLREWRKKKAAELEEKARTSREKHDQIIEAAKAELESFYDRRKKQVEQGKINNREKEKAFVTNLESLNAKKGGNHWEAVVAHVNFDAPTGKKDSKAKSKEGPVRTSTLLADAKPGKQTDLARMRQILLKLKHSPPSKNAPSTEAPKAPPAAKPVEASA